ncbi:cyclic nucleotide gated channel 1 [Prunus dulcis]|uniref:Cyclic nucleotide gated channel 1 n=1 Tax=Prunus dulcis TaxID=3755 RepID=A0A4Y1RHG5_PRUDU|nr:cyclic nucleotide gated channel 1 [Prunus dulcis]
MLVSRLLKTMKFLNSLVFLQYMPRALLIYRLCYEHKKAPKWTSIWVKSFFNLFLYILASHVIGAFWYYFSIQREIACWEYACRSENGCEPSTFSCDDPSLRNITILNELCPINPPNKAIFDFGIFTDALQSGVLQTTNFPMKFLNCFWWGLQNLSSLGQNLQTSNYPWENLFAVFISISGLLLFLYLMGNLQTYMLLSTAASEKQKLELEKNLEEKLRREMKLKGLDVELWLSRNRLPNTMKTRIMENVRRKLEENENVHVEILFVLPPDYLSYVKRCLCLATLRKVPKLKDITGLEELKGICEHFKPVIYAQDSFIIREGEPLDMILLVTQGTLRSYTTSNGGKKDPTTPKHIKQGDYYGEELISWASKFPPATELPISDKNVRSITRVEAFALTAEDLKNHVVLRYWWHFSKGIDLNKLTDSRMEQLRELAVIHSQRAFRRRKRAEKPAALPTKTQSIGEQHSIQQSLIQHWRKALVPFLKSVIEYPDQPKSFLQQWWNTIFVVSCVLAVLLDPLFFYIPIVEEDRKCLKLDKRLKAISFALRSLTDFFYIADPMLRILARPKARATKAEEAVPLKRNLTIALMVPIIYFHVVLSIFSKMRGSRSLKTMKFLNFLFVLQYVPRALLIYRLCYEHKKAPKKTTIWVKSLFNLFLYILASHPI